jgi:hypothetical protein
MNGGADDDFFFNNNNRQRQLTISTNSSTTSTTTTTVAKRFQCRQFVEKQLGSTSLTHAHESCFSAIDVEALSGTRLAAEHTVWRIEVDLDRYFKWFDLYVYPCFYSCNYFASAADVRTHILADHINNSKSQ